MESIDGGIVILLIAFRFAFGEKIFFFMYIVHSYVCSPFVHRTVVGGWFYTIWFPIYYEQ